jgi:flagellar M-ring protein FliF
LTDADIEQFTLLVKKAVGFDEARGDTVVVVNAAFHPVAEAIPEEQQKIWEKPVVVDSLKLILGIGLALALAFGLVRPMLKSLLAINTASTARLAGSGGGGTIMLGNSGQLSQGGSGLLLPSYDEKVAAVKNISGHDPAKVAQVVKKWVGEA